jgi:hypothetical protein
MARQHRWLPSARCHQAGGALATAGRYARVAPNICCPGRRLTPGRSPFGPLLSALRRPRWPDRMPLWQRRLPRRDRPARLAPSRPAAPIPLLLLLVSAAQDQLVVLGGGCAPSPSLPSGPSVPYWKQTARISTAVYLSSAIGQTEQVDMTHHDPTQQRLRKPAVAFKNPDLDAMATAAALLSRGPAHG